MPRFMMNYCQITFSVACNDSVCFTKSCKVYLSTRAMHESECQWFLPWGIFFYPSSIGKSLASIVYDRSILPDVTLHYCHCFHLRWSFWKSNQNTSPLKVATKLTYWSNPMLLWCLRTFLENVLREHVFWPLQLYILFLFCSPHE